MDNAIRLMRLIQLYPGEVDEVTRLGKDLFAVRRMVNLTRQIELSAAVGRERKGKVVLVPAEVLLKATGSRWCSVKMNLLILLPVAVPIAGGSWNEPMAACNLNVSLSNCRATLDLSPSLCHSLLPCQSQSASDPHTCQ